jgi:hypothetical protein
MTRRWITAAVLVGLMATGSQQASADGRMLQLGKRTWHRISAKLRRAVGPTKLTGRLRKQLANQAADRHIGQVLAHSRRNGIYFVGSDSHLGNGDGREDFRDKGRIPAQTIRWLTDNPAHRGKNITLVLAGDTVDVMEHVKPGSSLKVQKRAVTSFVSAHREDWTALAHAVVDKGLRVVLTAGNHDCHLVNYRLRKHLLNQIATQAGLTSEQRATFHKRVAYSGHAAPLGARGEVVSVHANEPDAFNSYRCNINPYTANRELEVNVGNLVVWDYYIKQELAQGKNGEGRTNIGTFLRPKALWQMAKLIHKATKRRGKESPADRATKAAHDRFAMQAWVERTGFHKMMDGEGAGPESVNRWSERWLGRQAALPTPLHNSLGSQFRLVNLIKIIASRLAYPRNKRKAVQLLTEMRGEVGEVRAVTGGHDHRFNYDVQRRRGRPASEWVAFNNTGTMTVRGKGTLVRVETDATGNVVGPPRSFWVDRATGEPTIPVPAEHHKRMRVRGWQPLDR